jgi:hypothetical protein
VPAWATATHPLLRGFDDRGKPSVRAARIALRRSIKSHMIGGVGEGVAMVTQDDPPTKIAELPLTPFELPKWLVEPAVRSCRLFNTALDFIFYDVPTLRAALGEKDAPMRARGEKLPSRIIDFDALSDPEGSLLLIDATTAPYVHKYQSVKKFLESPYQETRDVDIASITGVGSSALGSAALAWDISVALAKPVLAIVPGYGVADVVLQGLGGWFAFGLHDFLSSKTLIQTGRRLPRRRRASAASLPHRPHRSRPRAAARRSSATARAHRTCFMPCSNIARHPSACWLGIVRGRCRSTMRSNPFPSNGRGGCAW